ncbi:AraC family transcriptional regulator [Chitinophagaceae bacterium LB-8]|uniref:AraC family transcriptional regulator n=1 Tax=Paraflavisolibacter caeni TaxID=2982496 RepID=A0A9X2XVR7_9BACT|nr:AraC family transcriptional regulator [Paraflavisolibacter caeni]MCU7550091.1 AraC family transcriptional regulator [Paraflavisolibacter caeni]
MKAAIHKSAIPDSQLFVVKYLEEKHFDPTWHAHAEIQLFVVLEGTGTRFIGNSMHSFSPGELVLIGPHLPHLWRSDEAYFVKNSSLRTKGIVIYMHQDFLGTSIMEKEEMMLVKRLFHKSSLGLEFYGSEKKQVIRLMKEMCELKGLESVIHLLRILNLLSVTKEYRLISTTAYLNPAKASETDRMNKVYEYVLKNFRKKINLADMASLLHMTPTSFSRYFTMKSNKTFSRFLSEIRIKHACKLLIETDSSIEQVCYECGFNTLSNFNMQFKEIMSQKPSEYKKEFMNI